MKKKKIIASGLLGITVLAAGLTLASCDMEVSPTYDNPTTTTTTADTPTAQKVTVTFNSNGGTAVNTLTINKGSKATKPANPTKAPATTDGVTTSYSFAGWYTDSGLKNAFDFNTAVNSNITLYAKWNTAIVQTFTVAFNTVGGSAIANQTVIKGEKASRPTDPTKNADQEFTYAFAGWYKDQAYTTVYDFNAEVITGNTTIYAKWSTVINKYDVTWKNGDTILKTEKVEYGKVPSYTGSTPRKAADLVNTYSFVGWTPTIDRVTNAITYTATFAPTAIDYVVTFVDYDDTVISSFEYYNYGEMPYTPIDPEREETLEFTYEFIGWTPEVSVVTGNVTYKATYRETKRKYTVAFYNGDNLINTQEVEYGNKPTLPQSTPTKTPNLEKQYEFAGWSNDGVTLINTAADFPEVEGAVNYVAIFNESPREYIVKWNNEDGSEFHADTNWEYSDTISPSIDEEPTKEATEQYTYNFVEWSFSIDAETGVVTATPTFDASIRKYTVTWKNGDTVLDTDTDIEYDTTPQYDGEVPTKESSVSTVYTFEGWYDAETGGNKIDDTTKVTGDVTYYARYTESTRQYTYKFMNGEDVVKTSTEDYNTLIVAPETNPTKEDSDTKRYTFEGWYDAETGGNKVTTFGNIASDITYYAHYSEEDLFTIKFDANGGYFGDYYDTIYIIEHKVLTGASVDAPSNPSHSDSNDKTYTFRGWYTSKTGGTKVETFTNITSSATYYAQYDTQDKITVNFILNGGVIEYDDDDDNPVIIVDHFDVKLLSGEKVNKPYDPVKDEGDNGPGTVIYYSFAGWFTSTDGGTTLSNTAFDFNTTIASNLTLYAKYNETLKYEVTFAYEDESVAKIIEVTPEQAIPLASKPQAKEIANYTFVNWCKRTGTAPDYLYTPYVFNIEKITGPITLYALYNLNKFDIVFYYDDGTTQYSKTEANYGDAITAPDTDPTKEPTVDKTYTFVGWFESLTGGEAVTDFGTATGNKTYYARFTEATRQYTYKFMNGEDVVKTSTVDYNTLIVAPETNPTRPDDTKRYTFEGWYDAETGGNKVTTFGNIASDITYYAHYSEVDLYTIKFDYNGGKKSYWDDDEFETITYYSEEYKVLSGGSITTPSGPTKDDSGNKRYTFEGWYDAANGGNKVTTFTNITSSATYYAHYSEEDLFSITFDFNGGKKSRWDDDEFETITYYSEVIKVTSGNTITAPSAPTKEGNTESGVVTGYDFLGWFTSTDGGTTLSDTAFDFSTAINSNFTLYAKYKETTKYVVTFIKMDGTTTHITKNLSGQTSATDAPNYTEDGYTLTGWYTRSGDTDTLFVFGTDSITAPTTLYSKFDLVDYTITLNGVDGATFETANPETFTIETETFTLNNPSKVGYTFAGWKLGDGTGNDVATTEVEITKGTYDDLEFTATWTLVDYTITLNGVDGATFETANPETFTIETETFTLNNPSKDYYTFAGWKLGDGTGNDVATTAMQITQGTHENQVFTAIWTAIDYAITYDLAGGSVSEQTPNPATYTIETETFTLNNPTKDGYAFAGWKLGDADAQTTMKVEKGSTGDKAFTATWVVVEYTITYNGVEGATFETLNPTKYTIETPTFTLNNPTKDGYTFAGWKLGDGTGNDVATTAMEVTLGTFGDKAFTATWTPIVYNITYELAGGSVATANPNTYTIETETFTLNNPTKNGYAFAGWKLGDADAQTTMKVEVGSIGNKTFTATWTVVDYSITYNLAGGEVSELNPNPTKYTIETETFTLNNPTRTGYTFAGWKASETDTPTTTMQIAKGSTGDKAFTATWTAVEYAITYNGINGATFATPNPTTYTIETNTITLVNPTKSGYVFAGWKLGDGSGNDIPTLEMKITKGTTGAKSFTATWDEEYAITYNNVKQTDLNNPVKYTVKTETITLANPTKEGFIFVGWKLGDGSGNDIPTLEMKIAKGSTGAKSFTAIWNVKVEFNAGNATINIPSSQTISENAKATRPADPVLYGYTFDGWYKEAGFENLYDFNSNVTGSITLYAKFTEAQKYTITFETNGGSTVASQVVVANSTVSEPVDPFKQDYNFGGWYTDSEFTAGNEYNFDDPVTGDVTLYAKWIGVTYTIKFNSMGGSSVPLATVEKGNKLTKPTDPTRAGYTFAGWCTRDIDYVEEEEIYVYTEFDFDTVIAYDLILYAKWTVKDTYTVTYTNLGEGVADIVKEYKYGAEIDVIPNDGNGKTFVGWKLNDVFFDIDIEVVTEDMTLVAVWETSKYTVEFVLDDEGNTSYQKIRVEHGKTISKPADPTKDGYTFNGWYTRTGDGSDEYPYEFTLFDFAEAITGETQLFAKWDYLKTFYFNGTNGIDALTFSGAIEGNTGTLGILELDATANGAKISVRESDTQINAGSIISFKTDKPLTVTISTHPNYHGYNVKTSDSNEVIVATKYVETYYFDAGKTVIITAIDTMYLYSIVINDNIQILSNEEITFSTNGNFDTYVNNGKIDSSVNNAKNEGYSQVKEGNISFIAEAGTTIEINGYYSVDYRIQIGSGAPELVQGLSNTNNLTREFTVENTCIVVINCQTSENEYGNGNYFSSIVISKD